MFVQVDSDFVIPPINQQENAVYIALDSLCCITVVLATFVSTVMDTKLLLFAMRTQVEVQRNFHGIVGRWTQDHYNQSYNETLSQALNEMFNSYITTLFDID